MEFPALPPHKSVQLGYNAPLQEHPTGTTMTLCTVILAAGNGKRMHSALPKVLHLLAGRPLLEHVMRAAAAVGSSHPPVIVTGYRGEDIQKHFVLTRPEPIWVTQPEQLGTAHALQTALSALPKCTTVLVLPGDVPLVSAATLKKLVSETPKDTIGLVTATLPDPTGLGRIVRDSHGHIQKIIEEKDAAREEKNITEINSGIWLFPEKYLHALLPKISQKNAQGEFYLTDIIELALAEGIAIHAIQPEHAMEVSGINTRKELARLERYYQKQQTEKLMAKGVTLLDPARTDIRGDIVTGQDVTIDINVIFEGKITIGSNVQIGPNCVLRNVIIGDNTVIRANSVIEEADIAEHCIVGPFARIRPGTRLETGSMVGNFVEIKNSHIGEGSKISHLSYVGDCEMGKQVNVGAGTITCNYDGAKKHRTHVGDGVFIGSNSALVAPLTLHRRATIGAGSVITQDAPEDALTVARAKQRTVPGWRRPEKAEKTEKHS